MNDSNDNRHDKFSQLKRDIRGSKNHLIVGLDMAKDKHVAFFGTANGNTLLKRLVLDNNKEGIEKLLTQVEAIKTINCLDKVVFGLEPTANYHKPLGEYLINKGQCVVLVATGAVKKNRELLDGRWDKNDTKDAANIADLISQGKCLYYEYHSPAIRDLKSLLSLRKKLKKQEHSIRMRIRNHLISQYYPEADKYWRHCEDDNAYFVRLCLQPSNIAELEYEEYVRKVASQSRGLAQQRRLREIWQKAGESIGCNGGIAVEFEAKILANELKIIRRSLSETDTQTKEVCSQLSEYQYVISMPGYGPIITAIVIGTIGDPYRFNSASQLLKMAGLDLNASRSGKNSNNIVPSISKKGNADLRYALYQASHIATTRHHDFKAYFAKKLQGREKEKGIKTKMRVKISAKMLVIAWTLMKKKEMFDPSFLNLDQAKQE